jgi:hypothetical protein
LPEIFPASPYEVSDQVFVGSTQCLLDELNKIREMSPHGLGSEPKGYRDMRNDCRASLATPFALASELDREGPEVAVECVRWIWLALKEAGEIAIEHEAPMWT